MLPTPPFPLRTIPHRTLVAGLSGLFLLLSLLYNLQVPLWEAPEEPAHLEFIRYLQTYWHLPLPPEGVQSPTPPAVPGTEFVQLPLYYLILALLLSPLPLPPVGDWHRNPYVTWPGHPFAHAVALHHLDESWPFGPLAWYVHLARLGSGLLMLPVVPATYLLTWLVLRCRASALFAAAWVALSPGMLLASARVNNDAAAIGLSALTLAASAAGPLLPDWPLSRRLALMALPLTGALLSKANTAFLLPVVWLASVGAIRQARPDLARPWRWLLAGLPLLPGLLAVAVWWLAHGRHFWGRLVAQGGFGVIQVWRLLDDFAPDRLGQALRMAHETWWSGVGFNADITWPGWLLVLLALPGLAGIAGWGLLLGRDWAARPAVHRRLLAMMALGTGLLAYTVIGRQAAASVALDAHARFLMPAAPALALLLTVGLRALPLGRWRRPLALAWLGVQLALALGTPLLLVPQINAPTVPARLARDQAEWTRPALARFANGVELLTVEDLSDDLATGRTRPVRLVWRVVQDQERDFVVSLQLLDTTGERRTGADAVPHADLFPPRLWQRGEIVLEERMLPWSADLPAAVYTLALVLYYPENGETRRVLATTASGQSDRAVLARWRYLPPVALPPGPALCLFGRSLALRDLTWSATSTHLDVALVWEAQQALDRRLTVSVQVLDEPGRLVAQHDSEPVQGLFPTPLWEPGDRVRDEHRLNRPAGRGPFHLLVVVYDTLTHQRLTATTPTGPPGDHCPVGQIRF